MLRCLKSSPLVMPEIGVSALNLAIKYWADESATADELTQMRVACWKYLDSKDASTRVDTPDIASMRAIMCALYTDEESTLFEEFEIFFSFLIIAVPKSHGLEAMLRKIIHDLS